MFFPDLSNLKFYSVLKEFVDSLDQWLAFLPAGQKDKITIASVSIHFEMDYEVVLNTFNEMCDRGILERMYAINCPECNLMLCNTDQANLLRKMSTIDSCYNCHKDLELTLEDVTITYKLIAKPDPAEIKHFFQMPLSQVHISNITQKDPKNTLAKEITENPSLLYEFFFAPKEDDKEMLKSLYSKLDGPFENTTAQGAALDDVVQYMFNLVPTFSVTTKLRTDVNQIDCAVHNKLTFMPSIFDNFKNLIFIECKNEATAPGNSYFLKLQGIISAPTYNFAILVSRKPWTSTCDTLAYRLVLSTGKIIINLHDEDLKEIIFNGKNLLSIIAYKTMKLTTNSSQNLQNLFEQTP